ncbi:MAG: potassium-transporting ATPase subunit KdpB [Pirellulales bacterium]
MSHTITQPSIWNWPIARQAMASSVTKLDPRVQVRNPVMFAVYLSSILTTVFWIESLVSQSAESSWFVGGISAWLWITVLFANFAEAIAEGHGRAQAATLRRARTAVPAHRIADLAALDKLRAAGDLPGGLKDLEGANLWSTEQISASDLRPDDVVMVRAGEIIPADGEVVIGVASVDESAITGESAPVVRESGGDRSAVTGGTRVISDWLAVRVSTLPGQSFLDRMIAMVEGAKRQRTPNEIALSILLAALTLIFLLVVATLVPYSAFSVERAGQGKPISLTVIVALFVCLAPTTIGALLSAIGIAGMNRLSRANVIAMSGRAVEAAGDIDVLLLDKTGTITLGNRQATRFLPAGGVEERELAEAAHLASMADETAEGRSIAVLAKQRFGLRGRDLEQTKPHFVPFSARTRMSGVDLDGKQIRKGASEAIGRHVAMFHGFMPDDVNSLVQQVAKSGATPLVVSCDGRILGVIELKDVVKGGIKERFAELRRMGIKTVMITGDNTLTAAAIAAEAGVDDFLAEATPEAKLAMIRDYQKGGRLVAMTGDGTNDAPALAQADVAVAMNSGTQAAKEAGNMVDLDSNPTKLIEIVNIGKQLLMTRGALTTFSIANDVAKYFAILPAAFAATYPQLQAIDLMRLSSPGSAVLSAVIFNAVIIVALVPLALRGVHYRPVGAAQLLRDNLLIYGIGGLIVPFVGIKAIDLLMSVIMTSV